MNTSYIKKLIKLVEDSEIESLEVSSWGRRIRIVQKLNPSNNGHSGETVVLSAAAPAAAPPPVASAPAAPPAPTAPPPPTQVAPVEDTGKYVEITSPMVGTFYAAPAPDASAYVSINEKISVGQVVCIVEAMKLMNEIESEVSGRVVKILVENAQPVEFGQAIFLIDPD
jgi:acetyl-CoA carboxylase biotin carboxyl carrier protein